MFVLKISITAHDCARIYLSSADQKLLGFSELSGEPSAELRLFVSGIAAFLADLGLFELGSGEVDCTVSEVFDGIVVQMRAKEPAERQPSELLFIFGCARELREFCFGLSERFCAKLLSSELYRLGPGYYLIAETDCGEASLLSERFLRRAERDEVMIQKAREYGDLLSRTPIEDIRKLKGP